MGHFVRRPRPCVSNDAACLGLKLQSWLASAVRVPALQEFVNSYTHTHNIPSGVVVDNFGLEFCTPYCPLTLSTSAHSTTGGGGDAAAELDADDAQYAFLDQIFCCR